jgi:hypothetical protein
MVTTAAKLDGTTTGDAKATACVVPSGKKGAEPSDEPIKQPSASAANASSAAVKP